MSAVLPAPAPRAEPAAETVYRPAQPIDMPGTLALLGRGPYDPTTQWDLRGMWRTWRTPEGPATLRVLRPASDGSVTAAAWGPGAGWAIAGVPRLLGGDDDWSGLDVSGHRLLRDSLHRNPGLRLARTGQVLEALLPAIIEQRVTSLEAYRSWARLLRWYGEPAPGPAPEGMRVVPTLETWRGIPSWDWHRAGVDPRRARAAQAVLAVGRSLERAAERASTLDEAAAALQTVPGVGLWTAAETLQRSHGHPDLVSVGDYHLAHQVGEALIGKRVDDDGMLELLEPWAGHRQRVVRLIFASGFRFQRRGPRMTVQDHRWH
ncbi:DNA-3-methyladenine glycosylase 2 family protein [Leifsonia sp. F6_8S_P_1B]|uniref:DNA-3-methyladenine glycosylase 2 family protein n=1 Tax=Leifsonia williamsii TaxID=3035919 RepID=A0ABT8K9M9_9MICO|nr:DNA-3-methyladenine glycosylase 2 family protein [Leifsonia williamsii]MDN4613693.1 DNA-3-methyladenine glycosylase 2 family protein [Leifsonia williamsii]